MNVEGRGGADADLAVGRAEACLDTADQTVLDSAGASGGFGEGICLVLVPFADFAIAITQRGMTIGRQADQGLDVDVPIDSGVPASDMKRCALTEADIQAHSRRNVPAAPPIVGRGD